MSFDEQSGALVGSASATPARLDAKKIEAAFERSIAEIGKVFVGQYELVEATLIALFCEGNVLIEGVPGLGKTLLVNTLSKVLTCEYRRIQFTPDLMPSDITGNSIYDMKEREFTFNAGPIFTNLLLADEINRAPAKTQSALLEAMQERQVTVDGTTYVLDPPFITIATQNPLEQEGTYPLPEAQLDRFMFNVIVDYLPEDDEVAVVSQTTSYKPADIEPLFHGHDVLRFHEIVRGVPIAEDVVRYAVRLAAASRPHQAETPEFINQWISWGAGLRAAQNLVLGAKAKALLDGRVHVSIEDIRGLAFPTLRHRILVNYRAEAEGIGPEEVIQKLLETVK